MKRLLFAAAITLLLTLGCDRGGNTGGTPRSGEPGAKDVDRKPTSDPSAADGAPGGSNRGGERNR